MSTEKFLCWTDTNNRRYFAPISKTFVSIPGRNVPSGPDPSATVFIVGGNTSVTVGLDTVDYGFSDTSPGSIFVVASFFEALQWIKTGNASKGIYGIE